MVFYEQAKHVGIINQSVSFLVVLVALRNVEYFLPTVFYAARVVFLPKLSLLKSC